MKLKLLIPFFTGMIFILSSCSKDNTPATQTGERKYLSKIIDTSYNLGTTDISTITTTNYSYDSLNRLTGIQYTPDVVGVGIPENGNYGISYFYKDMDTLPFKASFSDWIGPVGVVNAYYTYDEQARVINYISIPVSTGIATADEYDYNGDQIIIKHFNDTSIAVASFDTIQYINNNITNNVQTDTTKAHAKRTVFDMQYSLAVQNPFDLLVINRHKPCRPGMIASHFYIYEPGLGVGQVFYNRSALSDIAIDGVNQVHYEYDVASGLPNKVTLSSPLYQGKHSIYFYYK